MNPNLTDSALDSAHAAHQRMNSIPATVYQWYVDASGARGVVYLSERWEAMTGADRQAILADWTATPIHPEDRAGWLESIERSVAAGTDWRHSCRVLLGDGQVRWIAMRAARTVVSPTRAMYTGLVTDITAEREEAERRCLEAQRLRQMLDQASDAFIEIDRHGRIVDWNGQAEAMFGWTRAQALGQELQALLLPRAAGRDPLAAIGHYLEQGVEAEFDRPAELTMIASDGSECLVEMSIGPVRRGGGGDTVDFAVFLRDLSARKSLERRMHYQATHDFVTGLPNRYEFMSQLERALATEARAGRHGRLGLLFIDLDGFKCVNDRLGHDTGDAVLRAFAERLRASLRKTDFAARLAGDEFVVLLGGLADAHNDALALAAKVLAAAEDPLPGTAPVCPVSASIGIALHRAGAGADELLAEADAAMYLAKQRGKNNAAFNEAPMRLGASPGTSPRPPLPEDEALRLRALHATRLLDSEPDELFDRITRIACASLNVPVALISLVDAERQWFKAGCGLDVQQTSRDISFCAYAVLGDEPLIVNDAGQDPRFAANPLVTGAPHVRFYAGVPLRSEGRRIGTLCVIDTTVRTLAPQDLVVLKQLARTVEDLIELRTAALLTVQRLNGWGGSPARTDAPPAPRRDFMRDPLTGLPNRPAVEDAVARLAAAPDGADACALLVAIDIDNLAAVNEANGHACGDAVLVAIAERLRHQASGHDVAARVSGSTFLLWLEARGGDGGRRLQALQRALNRPVQIGAQVVHGSVTLGCSRFGRDGTDAESLLHKAEAALRHAKSQGHGLAFEFDASHLKPGWRALEHELRGALARNELALVYQPKVDLRGGRVTGYEALLRWQHPTFGAVTPAQFIPVAEETGLIVRIGQWVLEQACAQLRAWRDAGHAQLTMAVNLSARQFLDDDMVDQVIATLARHDLPHGALELELTESTSMQDVQRSVTVMKRLKEAGVVLSIDDFGTGYSSLAYLKRLPIDKVKIDRAFVSDLGQSAESRAIVQAIVTAAHCLGLDVVAEGIEQEEQARLLKLDGCFEMQGYYFGHPQDAAACAPAARHAAF